MQYFRSSSLLSHPKGSSTFCVGPREILGAAVDANVKTISCGGALPTALPTTTMVSPDNTAYYVQLQRE
jgi:hypothetical protein